jgi:hypothetical protein
VTFFRRQSGHGYDAWRRSVRQHRAQRKCVQFDPAFDDVETVPILRIRDTTKL